MIEIDAAVEQVQYFVFIDTKVQSYDRPNDTYKQKTGPFSKRKAHAELLLAGKDAILKRQKVYTTELEEVPVPMEYLRAFEQEDA